MPKSKKELAARDAKRNIGQELLESVRDMKAGRASRRYEVQVPVVISVRQRAGLSQEKFAKLLGVSVRTLQEWEQGRREPSGAARTLIAIAEKRPEVLREVSP